MAATSNRRTTALLAGVVIVVTVLLAAGLHSFQPPPASQPAVVVSDAPDPWRWNETGRVDLLTIAVVGGDSLDVDALEIVVGTKTGGLRFSDANNWSTVQAGLAYEATVDGRPLARADSVGRGETITIAKTAGTHPPLEAFTTRVELRHRPSNSTLVTRFVTVR